MLVAGKTVLITGGASGVGKCLATRFLQQGAKVHVWDHSIEKLEQLSLEAQTILSNNYKGDKNTTYNPNEKRDKCDGKSGDSECFRIVCDTNAGPVTFFTTTVVDLANRFQIRRLVSQMEPVDIIVNAASNRSSKAFFEHTEEAIEKIMQVNAICPLVLARAFLPSMLHKKDGHFVTITNVNGILGDAAQPDFSASQWAAVGAHESIQMLIRREGGCGRVRTTLFCPYNISCSPCCNVPPSSCAATPNPNASTHVPSGGLTARKNNVGILRRYLNPIRYTLTPSEAAEICMWAILHGVERVCTPYSLLFIAALRVLPVPWFMRLVAPTATAQTRPASCVGSAAQGAGKSKEC
ncbi:putative short chain dehydrogenase putative (Acyl carrier protein) reductase [Trypanosoma vivax]|nr:hypothetical protein TRVL_02818 [Trypanosoma vivax]KAH8611153.1 putative short chain dehydrogenase putative (Acyl carrier protein) reductase [Trypanosoma vivax]